jgi:hypothetical protein
VEPDLPLGYIKTVGTVRFTNYPLLPLDQSGGIKDAVPTGKPHEYALVRISVTPVPGSPQFNAQTQIVVHQGLLTRVTLN